MTSSKSTSRQQSAPVAVIGVVFIVCLLYVAKPVAVPLALAFLLTFVLAPIVAGVQRFGLPRVYAVLVTTVVAGGLTFGLGWAVAAQVRELAVVLPEHKKDIQQKIERLKGSGKGPFGEVLNMVRDLTEGPPGAGTDGPIPAESNVRPVVLAQPKESGLSRLVESVLPVVEPLATAGLVVILVIFMLANKEDVRDRLLGLVGHGRVSSTSRAMADAAERVGRYLLSVLAVNVAFGIVFGIGLGIIGVPFAFLWGFLAAVLRFIPFLGTWAAASFPILLSVALFPDWGHAIAVFAFFLVLDLTVANVVEPLLFGHGTGVSPIALLVAAAFWAWLWGPIGLLLATPLTVCVVVLGQHVPRLGFLALLLGNAPALPPPARLYQRLFARDEQEAEQRVTESVAARGVVATFDDVVVPALILARRDRVHEGLTPEGEEFAIAAVRRILGRLREETDAKAPAPRATVLAVPAHHTAEEPTLDMLTRLLRPDGISVDAMTTKVLPSDVAARVAELKPAAVFVSVLPPGGLPQAAYLCRLLRKRFPALPIVVGWWGSERNFDKMLVKFRKAGATYVTTSLAQSRSQLRFVSEPKPTPAPGPKSSPATAAGATP